MQSLKSGEIKDIKMQYSNSVYTVTGGIYKSEETNDPEATKANGLSIFDNRTTRARQLSYQTTQRLRNQPNGSI